MIWGWRAPVAVAPVIVAALPLTWPALYNGYPLVFSDTGTYLSQAINHSLGWDRPAFYSLFMLPLHLTLTTWPVIAVQALLAAHLLHLTRRVVLPAASAWWLVALTATLSAATSLPWFASQLMPDLFTPLLVLAVALLLFAPDRLSRGERWWLVLLAGFMLAAHQSHLPLAGGLLLVLLPLRRRLGTALALGWAGCVRLALPFVLAGGGLMAMNVIGHGRASLAPFGNVFLLARVLYDGPGMATLARECPHAGWRLCGYIGEFPPAADDFLWRDDSPLQRAGGAVRVSAEADAIIAASLRAEPLAEARAFLANGALQLTLFATGDGLHAWPNSVTPWIERDFPAREAASYLAARQQLDELAIPDWLRQLHAAAGLAGLAGCGLALWLGWRQRHPAAGFAAIVLLAVLGNAAITGGLSGPHDRYQSRVMWLPPAIALLALPALLAKRMAARPLQASG